MSKARQHTMLSAEGASSCPDLLSKLLSGVDRFSASQSLSEDIVGSILVMGEMTTTRTKISFREESKRPCVRPGTPRARVGTWYSTSIDDARHHRLKPLFPNLFLPTLPFKRRPRYTLQPDVLLTKQTRLERPALRTGN